MKDKIEALIQENEHNKQRIAQLESERDDLNIRLKSWHDSAVTVADQRDAAYKRNSELEAELKNAGEAYAAKVYTVTELQRIVSEVTAQRDEARRQLEQAQREIAELTKKARHVWLDDALNSGDGVYRP